MTTLYPANPNEVFTVTRDIKDTATFPYQTTDETKAINLFENITDQLGKHEDNDWTVTLWNDGNILAEQSFISERTLKANQARIDAVEDAGYENYEA